MWCGLGLWGRTQGVDLSRPQPQQPLIKDQYPLFYPLVPGVGSDFISDTVLRQERESGQGPLMGVPNVACRF